MKRETEIRWVLELSDELFESFDKKLTDVVLSNNLFVIKKYVIDESVDIKCWVWELNDGSIIQLVSDFEADCNWISYISHGKNEKLKSDLMFILPAVTPEALLQNAKNLSPSAIFMLAIGFNSNENFEFNEIMSRGLKSPDIDVRSKTVEALYFRHEIDFLTQINEALKTEVDLGIRKMMEEFVNRFGH